MSKEPIPCGNCGETTIPFRTDAELVQFVCGCCGASGPWLHSQKECTAAWNRRFVCLDKNGDKVFAGDEVRAWLRHTEIIEGQAPYDEGVMWWDNKMLLWRVSLKGCKYEKKLFGTFYDEIELIKEAT